MEEKYYITGDLEETFFKEDLDPKVLKPIRQKLINIINEAFEGEITEFISYEEIENFFQNKTNDDEFIITLDGGLYTKNANYNYSSTRTYNSIEDIETNKYKLLARNGENLNEQKKSLISKLNLSNKKKVILHDDGIFSGDTMKGFIENINNGIQYKIKEIRVVLNFSGKNNIYGIPIKSLYNIRKYKERIDERDFFYGTKLGGASILENGKSGGIPYPYNTSILSKKASVPQILAEKTRKKLIDLNIELWRNSPNTKLEEINRLSFLEKKYGKTANILEVLELEK